MSKEEVIKKWRLGYSIDQIVDMSVIVEKTKKDKEAREKVRRLIKNRIEKIIIEYQS